MSMSTGDVRQPSGKLGTKAVAADGKKPGPATASQVKSSQARTGQDKSGQGSSKSAQSRPSQGKPGQSRQGQGKPGGLAKSGGGKGRKPMAPIKVNQARNWGPIMMFGGAGLVAVLIIGFAAFALANRPNPAQWRENAAAIPGINVFLESNPEWFTPPPEGNHQAGSLTYPSTPPVGGTHNGRWQSCMGDVYPAEIPKEQAVHSLEHGAVWITYRPDLPQDQIDRLADRVEGRDFMMLSPFPDQDAPISLQAWGYQLKVDNAGDARIDNFITHLRQNATQEPQAGCQGGITDTGTAPIDLPQTQ
jgi:hypothetical protein